MVQHPSHRIAKSEAGRAAGMLPGYAALRVSPRRRRTVRTTLLLIALGVVLVLTLVAGVFRPGF